MALLKAKKNIVPNKMLKPNTLNSLFLVTFSLKSIIFTFHYFTSFLLRMQSQKCSCRPNILQNILPSYIIRISSIVHWLHLLRKLKMGKRIDIVEFYFVKYYRCKRLKIKRVGSSKFCRNLWRVVLFGHNLNRGIFFGVLLLHF